MNKNMLIGIGIGIALVWAGKNVPGVKDVAGPVLTKVGI